ncbi:EAL domain-containing protein [Serratia sp. UGAL515B_01]|uniref:EAL domain-containing protein n=1 Tax=Serratia sp. UGAL515B_01 TaxID=2986763 RepID=UPI002954F299|nr:EAL domain-containing protein [Serratia sp. UGAL515B_01]WON77085.1 EAL domain-containing protein [Serratia sp. UGAL515B_01]
MRVRRSLTIKQMAVVSSVALVAICIFIVIQLFHFVQQRKDDYVKQLESIAHSVRQPLAQTILRMDVPETKRELNALMPIGILTRADIVLPNEFQALHANFPPERPVPTLVVRIFDLPVQITVPLYSLERVSANPQPLAYLVLQADSYRMYQFILSTLSTLLSTYLLLALILSIAITWCMNRLLVYPLRAIARELENVSQDELPYHQLMLPARHHDDELGLLVRNYNRNQQMLVQARTEVNLHNKPHVVQEDKKPIQELDVLLGIDQRQFSLFIQAQLDMQTHQVIGGEVLLRRCQCDGSSTTPADAISLAKLLAVNIPLSQWVLEASCHILAKWQTKGITLPLSVSISARHIQHNDFIPQLEALLAAHKFNPRKMLLQITGTLHISELDHVFALLHQLRVLGLSVAWDDFGIGYAGLNYMNRLKCLPLDLIKIDKRFIAGLPNDDLMARIIISISEVLNSPVIAQGVETAAQRDWLLQQGIRNGQGSLLAIPLPLEEFEAQYCPPRS